jgi:predicted metal-dependent phosphoesterase TrpH
VRADLHTHSRASDGVDTSGELVRNAVAAGLTVLALTDHDTVDGWGEAADAAREQGIRLIPGAEISCLADGIEVHMLSYLHDPTDDALGETLERTRRSRQDRGRQIVRKLSSVVDITWEDVQRRVPPGATVGRPHIADALIDLGVVVTRDEAFVELLHRDSPFYVKHEVPEAVEMIRLIRAAGGVPVMAHPLAELRGKVVPESAIADFARAGMLGLEVEHPDHSPQQRERARRWADRYGLFATGGSDYHGATRAYRLGQCLCPESSVRQILASGTGTPTVP